MMVCVCTSRCWAHLCSHFCQQHSKCAGGGGGGGKRYRRMAPEPHAVCGAAGFSSIAFERRALLHDVAVRARGVCVCVTRSFVLCRRHRTMPTTFLCVRCIFLFVLHLIRMQLLQLGWVLSGWAHIFGLRQRSPFVVDTNAHAHIWNE